MAVQHYTLQRLSCCFLFWWAMTEARLAAQAAAAHALRHWMAGCLARCFAGWRDAAQFKSRSRIVVQGMFSIAEANADQNRAFVFPQVICSVYPSKIMLLWH